MSNKPNPVALTAAMLENRRMDLLCASLASPPFHPSADIASRLHRLAKGASPDEKLVDKLNDRLASYRVHAFVDGMFITLVSTDASYPLPSNDLDGIHWRIL